MIRRATLAGVLSALTSRSPSWRAQRESRVLSRRLRHLESDDLVAAALAMVDAGAVLIDVGARSTAPSAHRASAIGMSESAWRGRSSVAAKVPVRSRPTRRLDRLVRRRCGRTSDQRRLGLRDPEVAALVRERGAGVS